jgi:hypothetical protein
MLYYVVLENDNLFTWLIKRKGILIMKFNYIYKTDIPVSIETNLDKLNKIKSALDILKDADENTSLKLFNDKLYKYQAEDLLKEVNNVISKVNEKFTH